MAAKTFKVTVTVYNVQRGNNTVYGNPTYVFNTDRGAYKTQSNGARAYALENDFQVGAVLDREVTLIVTAAGRVVDWEL